VSNSKTLKDYLDLPYKIELKMIPEDDGGGIEATLPELGRDAFIADGDTVEEALKNLKEIQKYLLKRWIESEYKIPEPEKLEDYSGKLVLRMPPALHKKYSEYAKRNGMSLNSAMIVALESYLRTYELKNEIIDHFNKSFRQVNDRLERISRTTFMLHGELNQYTELKESRILGDSARKIAVAG